MRSHIYIMEEGCWEGGLEKIGERGRSAQKEPTRGLPNKLDFEAARAHALHSQNEKEEKLARNQLKQPELSPDMEDWATNKSRTEDEETRMRNGPWCLVPERQINLHTLRGEQDSQNKIPYSEWSRDAKDHIKGKGKSGRL